MARDGSPLTLSEAELNAMESVLLDPVERLKAEQFVHQAHPFSKDAEIGEGVKRLQHLEAHGDPMADVLIDMRTALLAVVSRFLPVPEPPVLADDLPWPAVPEPGEVILESLEAAILRDR
jgi:hypothetical protein